MSLFLQNLFYLTDELVQFRPLETAIRNFVLYSSAVNRNHATVRIS